MLFSDFDELCESGFVVNSKFGKKFAVYFDFGFHESIDQSAVNDSVWTASGVDARDPQATEYAFAFASVTEGISPCLHDRLVSSDKEF